MDIKGGYNDTGGNVNILKTDNKLTGTSYQAPGKLIARYYDSGFIHSHDTYNGLSVASNGKVYYVLCSELMEKGGQMFCFDPKAEQIKHVGDLTEMSGEKDMKAVSQGKSHVNFYESNGKLYFSTHLGYYTFIDGMEMIGVPTGDYKPYRGGHILAYDLKTGKAESLCIAPNKEGILTTTMDTKRGLIYNLTWPSGHLFRYDLNAKKLTDLGPFTGSGERKKGNCYRVICRSIVIDPRDGTTYITNAEGDIKFIRVGSDTIETLEGENMRKDYFGKYEVCTAGSMAYNWRQLVWYEPEKLFYGVHGNSGYLFRFDPLVPRIELVERLTSVPSKKSGMFDYFSFGYLGFTLGPDGRTLYYLTGGPIYIDGKRVQGEEAISRGAARGLENLHLITWDIPTGTYIDHGPIFYPNGERPTYVNSIGVGYDGTIYTLARVSDSEKTDLISIPSPFKK